MDNSQRLAHHIAAFFGDATWNYPVVMLGAAAVSYFIVRYLAVPLANHAIDRVHDQWDDILAKRGVFNLLALLGPAIIVYVGISYYPEFDGLVRRLVLAFSVVMVISSAGRLLTAATDIYQLYPISIERPIKGYVQLAKLVLYLLGTILVICVVVDRSPWGILGGLGAMTAVLLLVFRDTILSFIAGIQLGSNDLVRKGDWIEVPQFGADGDVVDIALHTVKVRNWDNTFVTIPTYMMMEGSFKNWRGMSESGGRRIKRALLLDQTSVRFCDDAMIERLEGYKRLAPYIGRKRDDLARANAGLGADEIAALPLNRRALTNLGSFRAYCQAYLEENEKLHKTMTLMVRQLAPTANGLPLEIYAFTNDTAWGNYEAIQADIFDHLLSVLPFFELRVFQHPTGGDFRTLSGPRA
jgi:miniconductance mechanosensitive channel